MARYFLSGFIALLFGSVIFGLQSSRADELTVIDILKQSLEAERAKFFHDAKTIQMTARGVMDDPGQRYELLPETVDLPEEPRVDHWFVDFEEERFRRYYRRLHHGGHDLRFEELALADETKRIVTDIRRYQSVSRPFNRNLDTLFILPGYAVYRALVQAEADSDIARKSIKSQEGAYSIPVAGFDGRPRTLLIDAETHLVLRLDWTSPDLMTGTRANSYEYVGRSEESGIFAPQRIATSNHGRVSLVQELTKVNVNGNIPKRVFQIDEDLVELSDEELTLRVKWFAEDVGCISGPILDLYCLNFVVMEDGILVYDAPFPPPLQQEALAMISDATGGKEVKYVVISHHHDDHVRGIGAYWKEGVTIITSRQTLPMLLAFQSQETPETILERGFDPAKLTPRIILVEPNESLDLGEKVKGIRVFNLGPSPHVNDLMTMYLPDRDMVFQADGYFLFSRFNSIFEFVLSWADKNFDDPTIVGVHTIVAPLNELLARRTTQGSFTPEYLFDAGSEGE